MLLINIAHAQTAETSIATEETTEGTAETEGIDSTGTSTLSASTLSTSTTASSSRSLLAVNKS